MLTIAAWVRKPFLQLVSSHAPQAPSVVVFTCSHPDRWQNETDPWRGTLNLCETWVPRPSINTNTYYSCNPSPICSSIFPSIRFNSNTQHCTQNCCWGNRIPCCMYASAAPGNFPFGRDLHSMLFSLTPVAFVFIKHSQWQLVTWIWKETYHGWVIWNQGHPFRMHASLCTPPQPRLFLFTLTCCSGLAHWQQPMIKEVKRWIEVKMVVFSMNQSLSSRSCALLILPSPSPLYESPSFPPSQ